MRKRLALVVCQASVLLACPDLSGLSGSAADASSSQVEAGALDASIGSKEGGADAASDAALVDATADAAPFTCDASHAFCDDFEGGQLLDRWTSRAVDTGGKADLSTTRALLGKGSLSVSFPTQPGDGVFRTASVRKIFPQSWRHAIVSLDMWLDPVTASATDNGSGLLAWYYLGDGAGASRTQKGVYFTVLGSSTYIGIDNATTVMTPKFPENTWVHVRLDVDPNGLIEVNVGGSTWASQNVAGKWAMGANPEMVFVLGVIGYTPEKSSPAYSVFYDNVSVDFL